jgi:hypothetical protein
VDGGAITAAFRAGSNRFRIRLFVMTGEVRLIGKGIPICRRRQQWQQWALARRWWTGGAVRPKSVFGENDRRPKCVRAEPVAGNAIRAESDQSGPEAREPSVGRNGEGPKFVWMSGWQVGTVTGR